MEGVFRNEFILYISSSFSWGVTSACLLGRTTKHEPHTPNRHCLWTQLPPCYAFNIFGLYTYLVVPTSLYCVVPSDPSLVLRVTLTGMANRALSNQRMVCQVFQGSACSTDMAGCYQRRKDGRIISIEHEPFASSSLWVLRLDVKSISSPSMASCRVVL